MTRVEREPRAGRAIRRDPVLLGAFGWTALGLVLLFVLAGHYNSQVRVFWLFQPPLDLLLAYSAWRVSRIASGPVRRFWRLLTVAAGLFVLGDSVQAALTLTRHDQWSTAGGTVQSGCFAAGEILIIVAMLIHPHPGRSRREALAFWLDTATVMVGGAVVAWCLVLSPQHHDENSSLVGALLGAAVMLTTGFAAVKIFLSGNAPMHRAAAIPMIAAALGNGIGLFAAPPGLADGFPAYVYAIRFFPSLLVAMGPRIQEIIAGVDETAFGARRRKPYSLLPYGSIVVVFATLVLVLPDGRNGPLVVAVSGLGVIVALVVARQLAAFHDNTRLIDQLDTTLTELREHEQRLRHQALFDELTGLANRAHFREETTSTLREARPETVALLLVDLDGFKAVNDTHGHAAGDLLLAGVAEKLRQSVRSGDLVARLGGDEFALLLRDCTVRDAELTAQRILRAMTEPIQVGDEMAVCANASIGIACAAERDDVRSLLHDADMAMYASKHRGKGTWMRYESGMALSG
ncbi:GGDEF domain-containing protein [Actinoplanes oblitus]|uniref:GGDEF domain-containing protein n=1 Tax=Actinoplanes oblitus TaxID=3040509 RepID=A0ABY8W9Q6_9ACTN|nr:GGDEF domain-containing protein [Actinoplanes oblitus]WIM93635.1 GGDEF domain-containing protein [Actinoplanes oblitus]